MVQIVCPAVAIDIIAIIFANAQHDSFQMFVSANLARTSDPFLDRDFSPAEQSSKYYCKSRARVACEPKSPRCLTGSAQNPYHFQEEMTTEAG
jgi:hypothetical protein